MPPFGSGIVGVEEVQSLMAARISMEYWLASQNIKRKLNALGGF